MNPIIYGDDAVMSELMYGQRSDGLIQELRNQLNFVNPMLTDVGKTYYQQAATLFEKVSGWDAVRAARKAVQAVSSYIRGDTIINLENLEQLQTATPKMQRFIMSNPVIRQLHMDGRIDGYSETYVDIQPGKIGFQHYDYRVATHGIVMATVDEAGQATKYEVTQYKTDLAPWDEELSVRNRIDIHRTWAVGLANLIEGEEEPTTRFGGKL